MNPVTLLARRPAWLRPARNADRVRVPLNAWLILAVVFVSEYWWWHSRTRMWDGDALFYVASGFKYAGHSTDDALRLTGVFFHQESTVGRIQGSLTGDPSQPGAALHNMVVPRFFYSALAVPFLWVFGAKGIWLTSLVCAVGFMYVAMKLLTRLFDVKIALALLVLYMIAFPFWLFQTGIYTESLAALLVLAIVTRLPIGERVTTRNDLVWITVFLVMLAFTRQCLPIPMLAVFCAWAWTAVQNRSVRKRNEWWPAAAVTTGVGVVLTLAMSVMFPYNELRHYAEINHFGDSTYVKHHIGETLAKVPGRVVDLFAREFRTYLADDHALQVIWLLMIVAVIVRWRTRYAALTVGAFAGCALMSILDATGQTSLRYFVPMYPMVLMLLGDFARNLPVTVGAGATVTDGEAVASAGAGTEAEAATGSREPAGVLAESGAGPVGTAE